MIHLRCCSVVTGDLFPGVKRPGCEVNHSPPSSVEVKNEWRCTAASPVCLHGVDRETCQKCNGIELLSVMFYVHTVSESGCLRRTTRLTGDGFSFLFLLKFLKTF